MKKMRIGSVEVTRIEEMLEPSVSPEFLFPDYNPEILREHPELKSEQYLDSKSGKLISSMHSWLLQTDKYTVLIDAGCGNDKHRDAPFQRFNKRTSPYLRNLAQAGVRPEEVDLVICTHLHVDHVGWNTTLKGHEWVPTFPNARYIIGRRELAHWQTPEGGLTHLPQNAAVIADSVVPIIKAGLVELVDADSEILPGIAVEEASGHTAGQVLVKVSSGREALVFSGDCVHQPLQVVRPDWNSCFCEDPNAARATRRRLFEFCAERNALLLPAHFGSPHMGWIRRNGNEWLFAPAHDLAWRE